MNSELKQEKKKIKESQPEIVKQQDVKENVKIVQMEDKSGIDTNIIDTNNKDTNNKDTSEYNKDIIDCNKDCNKDIINSNIDSNKDCNIDSNINSNKDRNKDNTGERSKYFSSDYILESGISEAAIKDMVEDYNKQKIEQGVSMEEIKKLQINFPFKPYDQQKLVIQQILNSIINNKCSLIESPTGTGKSLAILSAIECFLRSYNQATDFSKENKTKIFVLSRTHVQINQLMNTLNKNYNISASILASRKSLCVESKVRKQADPNNACREVLKLGLCKYFLNKDKVVKSVVNRANQFSKNKQFLFDLDTKMKNLLPKEENRKGGVNSKFVPPKKIPSKYVPSFNIEDLITASKSCKGCPYYASRELSSLATITFAPYNYVLDPFIRQSMEIDIKDAIIVVDEAHNVENTLREAGTIEITPVFVDLFLGENMFFMRKGHAEGLRDLHKLMVRIKRIGESFIKGEHRTGEKHIKLEKKRVETSGGLVRFLQNFDISIELIRLARVSAEYGATKTEMKLILNVGRILTVLEEIFTNHHLYSSEFAVEQNSLFRMKFFLLDPSFYFSYLRNNARSVILLSGTLSPFPLITSELNTEFNILGVDHVVRPENIGIYNITRTMRLRNKETAIRDLKGTYLNLKEDWYILEVTKIILKVKMGFRKAKVGGGILVFLPSYNLVNSFRDKKLPNSFFESKTDFDAVLADYERSLASNPILFCVYRGKASEGTDFRDGLCRALIAVGVPFPNLTEVSVDEKKKFNDYHSKKGHSSRGTKSGSVWYSGEAMRAVNQAIGRVIRHEKDWGCVFLVDYRYKQMASQLSPWVSQKIITKNGFDEVEESFESFLAKKKV